MVLFSARSEVLDNLSPLPSLNDPPPRTTASTSRPRRTPDTTTPRRRRAPQPPAEPMEGISDTETRSSRAARTEDAFSTAREEWAQHVDRQRYTSRQAREREAATREQPRRSRVVVEILSDSSEEERRAASVLADEELNLTSDGGRSSRFPSESIQNYTSDDSDEDDSMRQAEVDDSEVVVLPDQTGARQFPIELSPDPEEREAERLEQYARTKEFEREAERRKERARAKREEEEAKAEPDSRARRKPDNAAERAKEAERERQSREKSVAEALELLSGKWSVAEEKIRQRYAAEKENAPAGSSAAAGPSNAFQPRTTKKKKTEADWSWRGDEFRAATERVRRDAEARRQAEATGAEHEHAREDSPEVEIVEPLPDLAKLRRIRAQFQSAERQEENRRKAAEDKKRRQREAEEKSLNNQIDEQKRRREAARRQREAEEQAKKQREEAARLLREEKEKRLREYNQQRERELQEALLAEQARLRANALEQERIKQEQERVRELLERERRRQEAEAELRAAREREAREQAERERRRREQERHAERMRRAQQREAEERLRREQERQRQPRSRPAHTVFEDDMFGFDGDEDAFNPFNNYDGFRYHAPPPNPFGAGFTFQQFTDQFGSTHTRFTSSPLGTGSSPRAAGPSVRPKPRPKLNTNPAPEDVAAAYTAYEQRWAGLNSLPDTPQWTFTTIPWPVTYPISSPAGIEPLAVRRFLLANVHSQGKNKKERVRAAMLRWHPDKFLPKFLGKVRESDKQAVKEGVNAVSRILQDLQTECA